MASRDHCFGFVIANLNYIVLAGDCDGTRKFLDEIDRSDADELLRSSHFETTVAKLLLKYYETQYQDTSLLQFVDIFMDFGFTMTRLDNDGVSCLCYFIVNRLSSVVEFIMRKNMKLLECDTWDGRFSLTPLGGACFFGAFKVVEILLKLGASSSAPSGSGYSLVGFIMATMISQIDIYTKTVPSGNKFSPNFKYIWCSMKFIIERGTLEQRMTMLCFGRFPYNILFMVCEYGITYLITSISKSYPELLNRIDNGLNVIHAAVLSNKQSVVDMIRNIIDKETWNKLLTIQHNQENSWCAQSMNIEWLPLMMKYYPEFCCWKNSLGLTIAHQVVTYGRCDFLREVIKAGAKLRTKKGQTALYFAIKLDFPDMVNVILRYCPESIDIKTNGGCTPLFYAIYNDNAAMVRILLEFKPTMDVTTNNGLSVNHLAAKTSEIRNLLTAAARNQLQGDNRRTEFEEEHEKMTKHWKRISTKSLKTTRNHFRASNKKYVEPAGLNLHNFRWNLIKCCECRSAIATGKDSSGYKCTCCATKHFCSLSCHESHFYNAKDVIDEEAHETYMEEFFNLLPKSTFA